MRWHQRHDQRQRAGIDAPTPANDGDGSGMVATGRRIFHEGELNIRGLRCTDRQRDAHCPLVSATQVDQFAQGWSDFGIAVPRWVFELPLVGVGNIELLVAAKRGIGGVGCQGDRRAGSVPDAGGSSKREAIEEDP